MIRRAAAALAVLALLAVPCAADDLDRALAARVPVVEASGASGGVGFGHACPIPQGLVTAWHVARTDKEDPLSMIVAGQYEMAPGIARRHRSLDAALWPLPEGMDALPVAAAPARKGDRVRIVGFEPNFEPRVVRTVVEYVVGAHVITKDHADYGSSGSCVVNEAGEVVAINIAGKPKATQGEAFGILIAIQRFAEDQFRPLQNEPAAEEEEEGVIAIEPPLTLEAGLRTPR